MKKISSKEVAVTSERIVDDTTPSPENTETNPTNTIEEVTDEFKAVLVTNPAPEPSTKGTDDENLEKMIAESPREGDQDSPGVLTGQEEPSKYRNIGWTTEEVVIDQINHFTLIPDYFQLTEADRPIVARTPNGYFCLDGWDLVEIARSQGATSILVDVDNMSIHSDEELCIRKMVLRLKTRGDATYMEIIRNSRDINRMLLSTGENLKVFSHGGRRDRVGLTGNREDDAAEILARRIRKDRATVQKHLLHCKFLSDEAIQLFIKKQAPKKFFEDTQVKKRILAKELIGKELSAIEITATISTFMIEAFVKLSTPKPAATGQALEPTPIETTEEGQPDAVEDNDPEGYSDEESEGNDEYQASEEDTENLTSGSTTDEPVTTEKILLTYDGVSKRIAEDVTKGISIPEMETRLKEELKVITKLLNMIANLSTTGK